MTVAPRNDAPRDIAPIRDAATIILLRREAGEASVLMGQRGKAAVFMPSKYVFPGGAMDPTDCDEALASPPDPISADRLLMFPRDGSAATPAALTAAALRELAEETGLLLGRPGSGSGIDAYRSAGQLPDASRLHYVFRAVTPPGRPRRFDARFFLADAAELSCDADDFSRACDELSHLHWVRLDRVRDLDLPFVTEVVLSEIAAILRSAGDGPIIAPGTVPFFDNTGTGPVFRHLGGPQP